MRKNVEFGLAMVCFGITGLLLLGALYLFWEGIRPRSQYSFSEEKITAIQQVSLVAQACFLGILARIAQAAGQGMSRDAKDERG